MAVLGITAGILSSLYGIGWYLYIKVRPHEFPNIWFFLALAGSCLPFIPMTDLLVKGKYVWALALSVVVVINTTIQMVQFRRLNPELL